MENEGSGWTARALARQAGLPPSTVASWVANGLVTADHYGRGRGGHFIGVTGLIEFITVVELRSAGISVQAIQRAVEHLRLLSGHERPLARLMLVVNGNDIEWKDAHELTDVAISVLRKPGQRLMVFPLGEQHTEMLHQLEADTVAPIEPYVAAPSEKKHLDYVS